LQEDPGGGCRYQMLETIREYGLEQLDAAGERDDAHRRHAAHFLALAERAERELIGPDQGTWLARLDRDHENLRGALGWALAANDGELALRLATALWRFWAARGHLAEGFGWLERALAASDGVPPALRAKALNNLGNLANDLGDYGRAQRLYEQSLAIRQELGDRRAVASTLNNLGLLATNQGDHARARALLDENLAIRQELRDEPGVAFAFHNLGRLAHREGDYPEARRLHRQALAIRQALGDLGGIAYSFGNLADVARDVGDDAAASGLFAESLALFREVGNKLGTAKVLTSLAALAQRAGDRPRAASLYREALALRREIGDRYGSGECLEGIAALAWQRGDGERAARLLGAAAAPREVVGEPESAAARADHERLLADLRAGLGPDAFAATWELGRTMPLDRVFDEAQAAIEEAGLPLVCQTAT
jgi:non-specific serine/threonine protein kinase